MKNYKFVILLPFIMPEYFEEVAMVDFLVNILKCLIAVFLIFNFRKFREHRFFLILLLLVLLPPIISTIINNGTTSNIIINSITIYFGCVATLYLLRDWTKGLKVIFNGYVVLIAINLLTLILFPNGLYFQILESGYTIEKWFLGFTDSYILYYFPAILTGGVLYFREKGAINIIYWICLFICLISSIITNSSTCIICLLFILIYCFFSNAYSVLPNNFVITYVILNLFFIIFQIQNYFSFFIEGILNKTVSLSGRDEIWNIAIANILEKPFLGYGFTFEPKFSLSTYMGVQHCHSYLLNLTYESGLVGCLVFIYFLVNLSYKFKNVKQKGATYHYVLVCGTVFLLSSIFDSFQKPIGLYTFFVIVYFITVIDKRTHAKNKNLLYTSL